MGMPNKRIGELLGISDECVRRHLKTAGLISDDKNIMRLKVEEIDERGTVTRTFHKAQEAADYYGVEKSTIRDAIYRRKRIKGHYLRYNPEDYEMKRGKKYKY
jgi:predicted transcriptional regulator